MNERTEIVEAYTAAILATYDAADPADIAAGLAWYGRAESTVDGIARTFGVSAETAAGVIATLSPTVAWSVNVRAAETMLDAARHGRPEPIVAGYRTNRRKAWSIANGADPDAVVAGPKVSAFFANLTGDPDRVTVDRWAARGAGLDHPDGATLTNRQMRELASAYTVAASRRGVTPRAIQAAVWVAVRGAAD